MTAIAMIYLKTPGELRYEVRWREQGRQRRKRFGELTEAEAFAVLYPSQIRRPPVFRAAPGTPIAERIKGSVVVDENGCWIWQLSRHHIEGYAMINIRENGEPKRRLGHRVSYETFIGPIPTGLQIDHLCRNRACVNPEHLEAVTARENILRSPITQAALNKAKESCVNGHPYDSGNTYVYRGGRVCKACQRARYLKQKKVLS